MKKLCYTLLAIILAGVIVFVGLFFGVPEINAKIRNAIMGSEVNAPDTPNGDETATGELVNVTEEKGIRLTSALIAPDSYSDYGIDAQSDTVYTITASVNADAVDKSVVGAINWANSSSAWASGKNISDYATLTQIEEYGLEFRLTIKQGFGEPITVKVASCLDSGVYGTCRVDYLKTMTSFTATLNPSLSSTAAGRIFVGDTNNTIQINPNYGVGTVEGNISSCKTTFTVNNYTKTNLNNALSVGNGTSSFSVQSPIVVNGLSFKVQLNGDYNPDDSVAKLIVGGGNGYGAGIIVQNFIAKYGCGDVTGNGATTAGVSSTTYEITYGFGSDYSVTLTWTDSVGHGFRNDGISSIATITNINVGEDIIVVPR